MRTRHYVLATIAAANLAFGCALVAHSEPLPDAPKPQHKDCRVQWRTDLAHGHGDWIGCSNAQAWAEYSTDSGAPAFVEHRQHFDRITWALIGADAGVRALDVYSTHYMLNMECSGPFGPYHCHVERIWPAAIANHTPAMIAASAACVIGNGLIARYFTHHNHQRKAQYYLAADIAEDGTLATRNLFLGRKGK